MRLHWVLAAAIGWSLPAMAQVTGKVMFEGNPPKVQEIDLSGVKECADLHADGLLDETVVLSAKGELANVVVSVKPAAGQKLVGEVPKTPAVMDQKGCVYLPRVLPMMVGQDLIVKNSDAFFHNVRSETDKNEPFNLTQPNKHPGEKAPPIKQPETFRVKCDVHPWMVGWLRVLDNPYFATTAADGSYSIADLPDGQYTFIAWQEKFGEVQQEAAVKGGKATVNFTFRDPKAAAPATQPAEQTAACPAGCTMPKPALAAKDAEKK